MIEQELALQTIEPGSLRAPAVLPLTFPWRDPKTVSKADLAVCIAQLEDACAMEPASAPLRTCLGIAHAVNLDVYASLDSLEKARQLDPTDYWAQQKYAELLYRLRALPKSEAETLKALELANSPLELAMSRKQLAEIRWRIREGTQKPAWTKPLAKPALAALAIAAVLLWVAVQL